MFYAMYNSVEHYNHNDRIASHVDVYTGLNIEENFEIIYCGPQNEVQLIVDENGKLYRTSDYGATYTDLSAILQRKYENAGYRGTVQVDRIWVGDADKNFVIFKANHFVTYFSHNCGFNLSNYEFDREMLHVVFHPYNKSWILASAYTIPDDFPAPAVYHKFEQLFITFDRGETWNKIHEHVHLYDWGNDGEINKSAHLHPDRILLIHDMNKGQGDRKYQAVYSDDFFKTYLPVIDDVGIMQYEFPYLIYHDLRQNVSWIANYDDGFVKPRQAQFPTQAQHGNTVFTGGSSQLLAYVRNHGSPMGPLYASDITGWYFVQILNNVLKYAAIPHLKNVIVANVATNFKHSSTNTEHNFKHKTSEEDEDEYEDEFENNADEDIEFNTVISYSRGTGFEPITRVVMLDHSSICAGCSLILDLYSLVYDETAVGLVMASGYVAKTSEKHREYSLFLSRDGGTQWFEVAKGAYTGVFLMHGSLIVIYDEVSKVASFKYSVDFGHSFREYDMEHSHGSFKIVTIEVDLEHKTSNMFMTLQVKEDVQLVSVNFEAFFETDCGPIEGDDWELFKLNNNECINGSKTHLLRRKADRLCRIRSQKVEDEKKYLHVNCECGYMDYYCDSNYTRTMSASSSDGHQCLPKVGQTEHEVLPPSDCPAGDVWHKSFGYRRVPMNFCMGGLNLEPYQMSCPGGGFIAELLRYLGYIVVLLLLAGCGYYLYDALSKRSSKDHYYDLDKQDVKGFTNANNDLKLSQEFNQAEDKQGLTNDAKAKIKDQLEKDDIMNENENLSYNLW